MTSEPAVDLVVAAKVLLLFFSLHISKVHVGIVLKYNIVMLYRL